jgi:glycosyltransferase involved in cell wall biosynthesis
LNLTRVNFTGVVSHREIGKFYNQADIFINASWLDNMPVSVIEAFAAGTPVVTTSPECMPYLVRHERTGLLSPIGDEKALAANVIRLLRDPALAARLRENAHRESQNYTWEAVRGQWLNAYRGLIGNSCGDGACPASSRKPLPDLQGSNRCAQSSSPQGTQRTQGKTERNTHILFLNSR